MYKLNKFSRFKFNFQFSGTKIGVINLSFPLALNFFEKKLAATSSNSSSYDLMFSIKCHAKILILKKTVFVLCSSYKYPPQIFDQQKFKKGGSFLENFPLKKLKFFKRKSSKKERVSKLCHFPTGSNLCLKKELDFSRKMSE